MSKTHTIYVSKVIVLHKLELIIITRSVHQRMPHAKEVVKLKKNNSNCFNITYEFD